MSAAYAHAINELMQLGKSEAFAKAINALHLLGAAEAKYFGTNEPYAVAARTDADALHDQAVGMITNADNLHQRAKRRMRKVMAHLMKAANDV